MVRAAIAAGLLVSLACGGGGGGGGSPSAPQQTIVSVSGTWEGVWVTANGLLALPVRWGLSQTGTAVTGTVTLVVESTFVFDLVGEVNGNFFSWEVPDSGCTTFEGKGFNAMGNLNPTTLSGNMALDGRACGDRKFGGPAELDKISSSSGSQLAAPSGGSVGDLGALNAEIGRRMRDGGKPPPI